jgi:hypothetical protein
MADRPRRQCFDAARDVLAYRRQLLSLIAGKRRPLRIRRGPGVEIAAGPDVSSRTCAATRTGQARFSGSHSAILALIQLFELWKSLTAFPGPTSSSRRSRS